MIKQLCAAGISLALCGGVFAADTAAGSAAGSDKASAAESEAIKLCERLAGTEREICMRQARENRRTTEQGGIGATPGSGGVTTGESKPAPSGTDRGKGSGGSGTRY